jgi:hypothetical protein
LVTTIVPSELLVVLTTGVDAAPFFAVDVVVFFDEPNSSSPESAGRNRTRGANHAADYPSTTVVTNRSS